jgi:hypothetical protein
LFEVGGEGMNITVAVGLLALALGAGCRSEASVLAPASHRATALTFGGPSSIANGGATTYTATATIARAGGLQGTEQALLRVMVRNDPGDDQEIARLPLVWLAGDAAPKTVGVELACRAVGPGFGVAGSSGVSPRGARFCPPAGGRCLPNPAVTYAQLDALRSLPIEITCVPPDQGS